MNILRCFILYLTLWISLPSSAITLSPQAEISILTCAPGTELYSLFGHTAIRVSDPYQKIDAVFNYGTFDFRTPHFYLKYAKGLLLYQLSVTSYENFISSYILDDRSVWSQTLQLDSLTKQQLFDNLLKNQLPENRTYLYNFLFDNCSTRVRDMISESIKSPIEWHIRETDKSFWNLLDEYLCRMPWVKWGIHTILGQSGSRVATPQETLFLPDYLMQGLASATNQGQPLAQPAVTVFKASDTPVFNPWYFSPFFVFSICSVLIVLILQKFTSRKTVKIIAIPLFLTSGLICMLLLFLGYFTLHPMTAPNYNLIWANPLNFIAAFFFLKKKLPGLVRKYLVLYQILLIIGVPSWFFLQPAVPLATLPILCLFIYLSVLLRKRKV